MRLLHILWLICANLLSWFEVTAAQCNVATTTLIQASDATSFASCATYTGTVVLGANSALATASLEGVEVLDGDLVLSNSSALSTIVSSTLRTITGSAVIASLPFLTNITLPIWTSVNSLTLESIPQPAVLNMPATQQQVTNVRVVNTSLEGLFGLSLRNAQMDTLYMADNRYLQNLEFGVGNISQSAAFLNNGGGPVSLPNLTNAYMLSISNASAVNVPLLKVVNGDLVLDGNSATNLSIPMLSFVGGDVSVVNNAEMTSVGMPELNNVGGDLIITGNDDLEDLEGFDNLNLVGGDLTIEGRSLKSASFPSLLNIHGDVVIQSEDNSEVCAGIPAKMAKSSSSCSSSKHGGLSAGAIAGIVVGIVLLCGVLIAAAVTWFHRRKRVGNSAVQELDSVDIHQMQSTDGHHAKELPSPANWASAPKQKQGYSMAATDLQEMPADAHRYELQSKSQPRHELG